MSWVAHENIQPQGWIRSALPYLDVMKRLSRGNLLISSTLLSFPLSFYFYKIFFHLVWVIATNPSPVTLLACLFILDSNFHTASSCHLNTNGCIQVCMFVIKPFQWNIVANKYVPTQWSNQNNVFMVWNPILFQVHNAKGQGKHLCHSHGWSPAGCISFCGYSQVLKAISYN